MTFLEATKELMLVLSRLTMWHTKLVSISWRFAVPGSIRQTPHTKNHHSTGRKPWHDSPGNERDRWRRWRISGNELLTSPGGPNAGPATADRPNR